MTNDERRFVIDTMTWSFSRLNSFDNCKYEWLQRYIEEPRENILGSCYAQFGSLCHELLEEYAKGEVSLWDLPILYEERFPDEVTEYFPRRGNKDFRSVYFDKGYSYFCNFTGFEKYDILGVEKKVEFELEGYPFIGFIDLLLKDKETNEIIILDHKSSTLKFKKNGDLSKTSLPKFEEFKKQLYLYSIPVIEEYGKVDKLIWNMFKDQGRIEIPWDLKEYEAAKKWAVDQIHRIEAETEWPMKKQTDYMYCSYLCSKRGSCPLREQEKAERSKKEFVPE